MKNLIALGALLAAFAAPAQAALDIGEAAPAFTTDAAVGGKVFKFSLAESLKKGPVVVYFFPAAFSVGCSAEAHEFAESIDKFKALGASVIGVSGDDIDTLGKFSVQECQGKFPVASDNSQSIMKSYDAVLTMFPQYANRISYVIAPNGSVVYNYQSLNPSRHVERTLGALREWSQAHVKPQ
jgi:peroxiredoxin Q/BCP